MKKFRFYNNLLGWLTFFVAVTVYFLTLEPTVSLWDCGEFIASAYKFQVGHPPGAPFFMLTARFASLFAGGNPEKVAMMVNGMSATASAFTILFLFWTITHLGLKLAHLNNPGISETGHANTRQIAETFSPVAMIIILCSGLVGALAYTFTDTFWFSAVEGEVYASSSFFTAIVFWAILKWENEADEKHANRWLIFIAYLMGLSIGVHLLNLLAIPAIVMVFYFRKFKISTKGVIYALLIAAVILGSIMYIIIPGVVWLASRFELLFVNGFGLPYNTGVLFYVVVLLGGLAYGIWSSIKNNKVLLNTILTCITVILLGYSSFAIIVIRSIADPPMDENDPETVFSLLYYINREQYGDRPLIKGHYFNARPVGAKEGKATYTKVNDKYEITNRKQTYEFDERFTTIFPRMWSSDNDHINGYIEWAGLNESKLYDPLRDAQGNIRRNSDGEIIYNRSAPKNPPGFGSNLRFFFTYQLGHLYFRYFMWNFAGRQNDIQGHGGPLQGNWISGITPVDDLLIGSQKNLPDDMKNAPSRNTYYFLPLLLGLFGLFYQLQRDVKNFWVVMLLFILTGIAIVVYLNQKPFEPRERDYSYAGSFYAFSIWIGLGLLGLFESLGKRFQNKFTAILLSASCLVLVPGILAAENWDDHNRSGRYTARDIAYNYLNACEKNAILFTNGDNDTFPLWYAQEVEGIRTDVRVVNLMLLNMDWYIEQMKRKAYESEALPISVPDHKYRMGTNDVVYIQERTNQTADLKDIMAFVLSDKPQTKLETQSGDVYSYIPTRKFRLPVDTALVIQNGTVKEKDAASIVSPIEWDFRKNHLSKSDFIVLDILANNNWERPVYYVSSGHDGTLGLDEYFQLDGFAYRLVPIRTPINNQLDIGRIDADILYDRFMNTYQWGNMNDPSVYLDDFNVRTMSVVRLRNRFVRLADELTKQGQNDRAIMVLDKCHELTPHEKIPFDYFSIAMAGSYFRLNAADKANAILGRYGQICDEYLTFYLDQQPDFINSIQNDIQYSLSMINRMAEMSRVYNQQELNLKLDSLLNQHYKFYVDKLSNTR
ncbi:MAG: DUF2723 domain-containing protein [Bacteroidales bacterium]|nr:DUF2723 domain-containing protein [Bacteroidales bacterium]